MPDCFNRYSEKFQQADTKTKLLILIVGFILLMFLLFTGLFVVVLAVLGIIYYREAKLKNQVETEFKEHNLQAILQDAFPGATYDPTGSAIDGDGCRECNLFPIQRNRYRTEDGLKMQFGNNNDISLDYVEVYTYEMKSDSDGDSYESTLFRGGLLQYTFFKKFKDSIYVIPNETNNGHVKHGLLGGAKPVHNPCKSNKALHKCELEDVEFNEFFSVYSDNDAETFYILTPQYIKLMKDLYEQYNHDIRFKFSDNNMYVAIDGMDLFDFKLVYANGLQVDAIATHEACVEQTKTELNSLVEFAKTLELGDSIFY